MPRDEDTFVDALETLKALLNVDVAPGDRPALQAALAGYLERAAAFRAIDPGAAEPPVITFEREETDEPDAST